MADTKHLGYPNGWLTSLSEYIADMNTELERTKAENAKLRELVSLIWLAGDFSAFLGIDEVKEQMRELGIEVEDA